ncbi:MAG TPA: hypothetical protein VIH21_12065, partial [Dehalococcoidia bacterium]
PRELSAESYEDAIDFAGKNGDIVLIQRAPAWEDFLPDGSVSDDTARATGAERDAVKDQHLKLFFAIDPTDGSTGRDRLAGLPGSLAGKRFDDPDVRSAFVAYAEYIALNYKPAYMALGVEMNLYYEKNKEDFENFESLYRAAYDAVKRKSPKTQVTLTFQYEDLLALLPREDRHFQDWQIIKTFDDVSDFVAISTYPSFVFDTPDLIPANYYSQLQAFTSKPIAIAEMGYASAPGQQGVNSGTEEEQTAFLRRALDEAGKLSMPFVVWFAIWDPTFARDTAFGAFQSIGLRRDDDAAKAAWAIWAENALRPYERPDS